MFNNIFLLLSLQALRADTTNFNVEPVISVFRRLSIVMAKLTVMVEATKSDVVSIDFVYVLLNLIIKSDLYFYSL